MTVFDAALLTLFGDPNLAEDALWRPGGTGAGQAIRIIRVQPQPVVDIGGAKLVQDGTVFDVLVATAAAIAERDTIEAGGQIYRIQAPPMPAMDGRVYRLDLVAT
jgi:hypothetical protein